MTMLTTKERRQLRESIRASIPAAVCAHVCGNENSNDALEEWYDDTLGLNLRGPEVAAICRREYERFLKLWRASNAPNEEREDK